MCKKSHSEVLFYQSKLDSALLLANEWISYHREQQDSLELGKAILYRGQVLKELGHYSEALDDYLAGLDIFQQMNSPLFEAYAVGELATIYAMSDENNKAIRYGQEGSGHVQSA